MSENPFQFFCFLIILNLSNFSFIICPLSQDGKEEKNEIYKYT